MFNKKVKSVLAGASRCLPESPGLYPADPGARPAPAASDKHALPSHGKKMTASRHEIIATLTRSVATLERRTDVPPEIVGAAKAKS